MRRLNDAFARCHRADDVGVIFIVIMDILCNINLQLREDSEKIGRLDKISNVA